MNDDSFRVAFTKAMFIELDDSLGGNCIGKSILSKWYDLGKKSLLIQDGDRYSVINPGADNRFYWLIIESGTAIPRPSNVVNVKKYEWEENPRSEDQVETREQIVFLYDSEEMFCYISDLRKKGLISNFFSKKLNASVIFKECFKSVDEFCAIIKKVNCIKFTMTNDLFSQEFGAMAMFQGERDFLGLGVPVKYELKASFRDASVLAGFARKFKALTKRSEVSSVVCIGRDSQNIESIFNMKMITQKIDFVVPKLPNGLFDTATALQSLKNFILNKNYA